MYAYEDSRGYDPLASIGFKHVTTQLPLYYDLISQIGNFYNVKIFQPVVIFFFSNNNYRTTLKIIEILSIILVQLHSYT
jgi:hypothetical protein